MSEQYGFWAILEMARAHREEHPECADTMDYIIARCENYLDDGR